MEDNRTYRESVRVLVFKGIYLLLAKKRHLNGRVSYIVPGGGVEIGETREEACVKECLEEVGAVIKNIEPLMLEDKYNVKFRSHEWSSKWKGLHDIYYRAEYAGADMTLFNADDDGMSFMWVNLKQAIVLINGSVKDFKRKKLVDLLEKMDRETPARFKEW